MAETLEGRGKRTDFAPPVYKCNKCKNTMKAIIAAQAKKHFISKNSDECGLPFVLALKLISRILTS